MDFATALFFSLAYNDAPAARTGHRNKFDLRWIRVPGSLPYLQRTPADGSPTSPWGRITADDFFAHDWTVDLPPDFSDSTGIAEVGSSPWAVAELLAGRSVRMEGTPLVVFPDTDPGNGGSRILRLRLPNGATPYWEFAPVDLVRRWESV